MLVEDEYNNSQKLLDLTIYTVIRALTKTEQRINTKNLSKNFFRKILNAYKIGL